MKWEIVAGIACLAAFLLGVEMQKRVDAPLINHMEPIRMTGKWPPVPLHVDGHDYVFICKVDGTGENVVELREEAPVLGHAHESSGKLIDHSKDEVPDGTVVR